MKPNKKDVTEIIQELHDAMLENIEASDSEEKIKVHKIKAQKRLALARDAVRAISF